MSEGRYFWDRQEWYWSALSFFSMFFIVFLMVCLCWKFFHPGHDDYEESHVIVSRDPAPSLIILHAQTPSENERILRRYQQTDYQPQFYHHSLGGEHHVPYNCAEMQKTSMDHYRPPPYAPNH